MRNAVRIRQAPERKEGKRERGLPLRIFLRKSHVEKRKYPFSPMLPAIPPAWKSMLEGQFQLPYFTQLKGFLAREAAENQNVLPPEADIFSALHHTPPGQVRVLLLGQDPYPNPGDAHGLCFSVRPEIRPIPRSLQNIYRELQTDVGFRIPNHGCLESWA